MGKDRPPDQPSFLYIFYQLCHSVLRLFFLTLTIGGKAFLRAVGEEAVRVLPPVVRRLWEWRTDRAHEASAQALQALIRRKQLLQASELQHVLIYQPPSPSFVGVLARAFPRVSLTVVLSRPGQMAAYAATLETGAAVGCHRLELSAERLLFERESFDLIITCTRVNEVLVQDALYCLKRDGRLLTLTQPGKSAGRLSPALHLQSRSIVRAPRRVQRALVYRKRGA